jgi:hypothetical protein
MRIFNRVRQLARSCQQAGASLKRIPALIEQVNEAKILAAQVLIRQIAEHGLLPSIREAEFKVFSQFGEDGIIQYLIRQTKIPVDLEIFIEVGVETYEEANTRFLLANNNWRGLIMDGNAAAMAAIQKSSIYWRHDLTAMGAFIDKDNIDHLIRTAGFGGEIGLLSIDIDGNDYWVWESIKSIIPVIVVIEYNSLFGSQRAVTVPYDARFFRTAAHYSNLYFGCSLKALELLGQRKGYALVGSNSTGSNAFFVRRDYLHGLVPMTAEEAYVELRGRQSRDIFGNLTFLAAKSQVREIGHMKLLDLENGCLIRVSELLNEA